MKIHFKFYFKFVLVFFQFLLFTEALMAAENKTKPQTLDFEGEVIEGEAMRPDLFLQITTPELSLESILYMRKDFNDFHKLDKNKKPKFVPEKK